MRRSHLGLVAVALVAAVVTGHSYTTYSKWQSSPVTFYVNPATPDLSPSAAIAATEFALNVWNTQGSTPFRFQYGGTNSDTTTAYDNRNVVIFRNASNGSAIASTYSWWDGNNRLLDTDVVVWDGGFTFFTGTSGCGSVSNAAYLEDILTHEFGHALGLNHSTVADATMYPSYSYCSQGMRTLASDDIAGVQSLYGVGTGSGSGGGTSVTQMSSPAQGSTLAGSSQTFTWTAGSGATSLWLYLGSAVGEHDLFEQALGSSLSVIAGGLPTDGRRIYARLWWVRNGAWEHADTTYTAAGNGSTGSGGTGTTPAMTTPAAGSILSGSSQTFTWTAGSGATSLWLYLGSAVGEHDLFEQALGSSLSVIAGGLPTDGRRIYARLWWVRNGAWEHADTTYTAAGNGSTGSGGTGTTPAMTTPAAGSILSGSSQTFTWTAGSGATSLWLYLGSAVGEHDLFEQALGSSLSVIAGGLPTDGRRIYARLWWVRNGAWEHADTTYTAAGNGSTGSGGTGTTPAMTTPAAGSILSGSSQTFTWTAGSGATSLWLYLGSAVGEHDLFEQALGSSLSVIAGGLPTDGRRIYARLWWIRGGTWEFADSSYNAAGSSGGGGGGSGGGSLFVAPGGTGDGSSAAPFGRVQDALAVAQPGDRISIRSGTYIERMSTVRNGSSGQPITLVAADGRGTVIVTASGRVLTVNHSYIAVDGLVLDGQYGADDLVRLGGNAHFFELRNSELRRSSRDLIDMGSVQGVTISGCLLHHALNPTNGVSDAHGIVAAAVTDLTVRDSEIHTFSGDGLQVDAGRSAPGWSRVTVERTRIWLAPLPVAENGFAAGVVPGENAIDTKASLSYPRSTIVLRDITAWGFRSSFISNAAAFNLKENVDATVDRVTVYDSVIAFRLRGPDQGGAWVTIKNAVVFNTTTAFRYEDNIANLHIWNSTVGRNVSGPFQAASSVATGLDVRNLLFLGGALPPEAVDGSNRVVDASSFVNAAANDYHLTSGSLAVDTGVAITAVTTDRDGVSRPQGSAQDVGAYERPSN